MPLPHITPLCTCPSSQTRRESWNCGGFEGSVRITIPLTFKVISTLLRTVSTSFEIWTDVWFISTEVLRSPDKGICNEKLIVKGIVVVFWLLVVSLFRRVVTPHSTLTFWILHWETSLQAPAWPNGVLIKTSMKFLAISSLMFSPPQLSVR